jgi:hypothetical protein
MAGMSLLAEYKVEVGKDITKVNKRVVQFHRDLVKAAPVDTGEFKDSWELIPKGILSWTIKNPMDYASILWVGRRQGSSKLGNPKWYGSEQWSEGGDPMLAKFKYDLERL